MRENLQVGMIDVDWLRILTESHKGIPEAIKERFPIIESSVLLTALVKVNRSQVTLIACPDVAEAAVAIPFFIGAISAANSENFKIIVALKTFTEYTIEVLKELTIISDDDASPPLKLHHMDHPSNQDTNLLIATYPKAFNYVEEAIAVADSHLTHLVIEGFDGENCLDMEMLFRAIQLAQRTDKFRVILLTDGLVLDAKRRVEKLCDGGVSLKFVDLLQTEKQRLDREVIVTGSTAHNIIQVKEEGVSAQLERSKVTEVNIESEEPLALSQLTENISDTAWLIKHFMDDETKNSPFIYVVFTASHKVMRLLLAEIRKVAMDAKAEIVTVKFNNDIKYASEKKGRVIVLVSDLAEDAFVLDNINIVFDMGLISWRETVSSVGRNDIKTMWADRVRMIRRAKRVERGTVVYPFNYKKLQWMRTRSISKFPGYDLEMRYFHDSKEWSHLLNEERTNRLMKRAEDISIRAGLISYRDPRYCTPMGSFCSAVLPMLSPRLAKLVLCGIVCGCEDAAIALVTILTEESVVIDCGKSMGILMDLVNIKVRSEHLAILHAYDSRYDRTKFLFTNFVFTKKMEKRERLIRTRIKKEPTKVGLSVLAGNAEVEKRLLLALAMAFGDRVGYAAIGGGNGETRFFHLRDPDNGEEKLQFETSTKFPAGEEEAGVYYEMREKGPHTTAEVTFLPVTILGAIGNIGGRVEKSTKGLALTTNTGGLHVQMGDMDDVDEMMEMREEVRLEVQRVALSYLQSDRYIIQFKTERDQWMDQLIPLLTPHSF